MVGAAITILKLFPAIVLFAVGLRFIFDIEDFNLRRIYRRYVGRGDWRSVTRLTGVLFVVLAVLYSYFVVWPEVDSILNPDFVPGQVESSRLSTVPGNLSR